MYTVRVPIEKHESDPATDAVLSAFELETSAAAALEINGAWVLDAYYVERPLEDTVALILTRALDRKIEPGDVSVTQLADQDWVRTSLEGLPPVLAGRFLVHGQHDRNRVPAHAIGIEIEAGLAFGTGHHATTKGCLIAIDRVLKRRQYVNALDLGTGTGVLAAAIARASHIPVLATDIDRDAVIVSDENVRANQVGAYVDVVLADGPRHRAISARAPYDLIVANILANPLIAMSTGISRLVAANGTVILSGLLSWQARTVTAAYRNRGLVLSERIEIDGWTTLILKA